MSRGTSVRPPDHCEVPDCKQFAITGATKCSHHLAHNQKRFRTAMYKFKSPEVQTAFELMLRSDDRMSLDNELGLIRTCLDAVVSKCDVEKLTDMGPHTIAAITSLASEVGKMCDTMARLEMRYSTHVPMETLLFFIQLIAETLSKHVDEDKAQTIISAILELPLPQVNVAETRSKTLPRGTYDPNCCTPQKTLMSKFANRKDKIDDLRQQAQELREEIAAAGGSVDSDAVLAPAEPEEESAE